MDINISETKITYCYSTTPSFLDESYLSQDVLFDAFEAAKENITQTLQDCCGVQLGPVVRGQVETFQFIA